MKKHLFYLTMILAACAVVCTFTACGGDNDDDPVYEEKDEPSKESKDETQTPAGTLLLMRACATCDGTKLCVDCKGTGKGCKRCKGTGEYCSDCGGSGECDWCYGSKECHSCYGKGGSNCTWCMSKPGYCGKCVGTGMYGTQKCTSCNGTRICHYCGGNYFKKCSSCNGTGDCSHCYGRGICPTCYGDPVCSTCGGDGHCQTCTNQDGKCAACKGSGEESVQSFAFTEAGGTEKVLVHCTADWTVSADADWISCSRSSGKGDATVTLTAAKNATASQRDGVITFACGKSSQTIKVQQIGEALRLTVEPTTLFISSSGGSQSFSISSNSSWTVRADESWLKFSPASGSGDATISVSGSAYTAWPRYAVLTIEDDSGEASVDVRVAQAESAEALNQLKTILEYPLGTIDRSIKTYSFSSIKSAVSNVYAIREFESSMPDWYTFYVYVFDNPSLSNWTYQGLTFFTMDVTIAKYIRSLNYSMKLTKPADYKGYLNRILQDFRYNLGIALAEEETTLEHELAAYEAYDAEDNHYIVNVWDYSDYYSFSIHVIY